MDFLIKGQKSTKFNLKTQKPTELILYVVNIILDILNPTLYHKVKSIEIELGASDDEDILDKSIKVQTALPSRKQ